MATAIDNAPRGNWRFKKADGLIYGPVPASVISEQIASGELNDEAQIAPEDGPFRPLKAIPEFHADLLRAQATRKVHAEAGVARKKAMQRRAVRIGTWVTAGVAALAAVVGVAVWLAGASGKMQLPQDPGAMSVTASPPMVTTLTRRTGPSDGELIDYGSGSTVQAPPERPDGKRVASSKPPPGKPGAPPLPPPKQQKLADARPLPPPTAPTAPPDKEGLVLAPQYDQAHINEVVAKNQRTLFPCFTRNSQAIGDFRGAVPIAFAITNEGRVGKLWVDVERFKSGPVYECLVKTLGEWRFKRYSGEQANVEFSIKLGR